MHYACMLANKTRQKILQENHIIVCFNAVYSDLPNKIRNAFTGKLKFPINRCYKKI